MLRSFCEGTPTFPALTGFAKFELSKFEGDVEIVCGPITTGGQGSVQKNLEVFNGAIAGLIKQGRPVFNQMPYETALFRLRAEHERKTNRDPADLSYNPVVLEEFYRPLFETRRFTRAWFLPGWRSSKGACWERGVLLALGAHVTDLSEDHLANLLSLA